MSKWPYNTQQWKKVRRIQLSRNPFCKFCHEAGRLELATVVDHIKPVREYPELAFHFDSLQSLCKICHDSAKKKEEIRGRKTGCDENGTPLGGW